MLPMTDESGAAVVKKRLQSKFEKQPISIVKDSAHLVVAISITAFDKTRSPDHKTFMGLLQKHHAAEEEAVRASIKWSA